MDSVIEHESIDSDHEELNEDTVFIEPRRVRVAATGVADLIKSLKPRKIVPDKVKLKKVGSNALGGYLPSPSS